MPAKTNLDALKRRVFGSSGGKGGSSIFKPSQGELGKRRYQVRLLPPREGEETPFFRADIHYFKFKGQKAYGACPQNFDEECPADELYWKLYKMDLDKPLAEALKKVKPQTRFYTRVLVRGWEDMSESGTAGTVTVPDADQGIKLWSMSWGMGTRLKDLYVESAEQGVFIDDVEEGRDLWATFKERGTSYVMDSLSAFVKPTPLGGRVPTDESEWPSLENFAYQRKFTPADVEELLPKVLGEFYEVLVKKLEE